MYLTKLVLDNRNSHVINALNICQEMHTLVMRGFDYIDAETARKELGVLYSIASTELYNKRTEVFVQSKVKPNWKRTSKSIIKSAKINEIGKLVDNFNVGDQFNYTLKVHTYKMVGSKRVTLVADADKLEWLLDKAEYSGFKFTKIETGGESILGIKRNMSAGFISTIATGELEVTNKYKFTKAFKTGIGPGKAYGLGMLLLEEIK